MGQGRVSALIPLVTISGGTHAPECLSRIADDCESESGSKVSGRVDGKASLSSYRYGNAKECEQDGQGQGRTGETGMGECEDASHQESGAKKLVEEGRSSRETVFGNRHKVARRSSVSVDCVTAASLEVGNGFCIVALQEMKCGGTVQDSSSVN